MHLTKDNLTLRNLHEDDPSVTSYFKAISHKGFIINHTVKATDGEKVIGSTDLSMCLIRAQGYFIHPHTAIRTMVGEKRTAPAVGYNL